MKKIRPISLYQLSLHYLQAQRITTWLHISLIALGMAMMCALLLFGDQLQQRLFRDAAGIDVVIGAKGSPLQLILSSIQHEDIPTGNIPFSSLEEIRKQRIIKQAIPLALGDQFHGFRIVGTESSYIEHYHARYAHGNLWSQPMQVVLGAQVALTTGLRIGDQFAGSHGLIGNGDEHTDHPYRVVGILQPTHSVMDRLILTSMQSVWMLHDNHHETTGDITAILAIYSQRAAALSFPQYINRNTPLLAASPAFEMAKLLELLGIGTNTILAAGILLICIALLSVFIGLLTATRQRTSDLAIMRILGASPRSIFTLVMIEGMLIALCGSVIGMVAGHALIAYLGSHIPTAMQLGLNGFVFLPAEAIAWACVMFASVLACTIPAWEAYRTPITSTLKHA